MIDPATKDIGRKVVYRAASGLREAKIKSFSPSYVFILFDDEEGPAFPARREFLEWAK
jgi:hypothetical protein